MKPSRTCDSLRCTLLLGVIGILVSLPAAGQPPLGYAEAYDPACLQTDDTCHVWRAFRRVRPYPFQDVIIGTTPTGEQVVIISEPPPHLQAIDIDQTIADLFGERFRHAERRRWSIGLDGWLEDLVVTLAPPIDDEQFEDQLAFLYHIVFDTTFGGEPLFLDEPAAPSAVVAHGNLEVSAAELHTWITDPALRMYPLAASAAAPLQWKQLMQSVTPAAYSSRDGTLIALVMPRTLLRAAREVTPNPLQEYRALLRRFFVASDLILGAVWNDEAVVFLGRGRQAALSELPALRSETTILLAEQRGDQLAQSYERSAPFAGRLWSGDYARMDWAPIYLSPTLVDTELGTLLNITDQVLKSWSEAGTVEYLYFDYPLRPEAFVFGPTPLSRILRERHGSTETLFNWNTAGAASIVQFSTHSVFSVDKTGSLTVTYGSNTGESSDLEIGHLYDYEERAYAYFADHGDPNLIRVRQYTTLYQIFRAIAEEEENEEDNRGIDESSLLADLDALTTLWVEQAERELPAWLVQQLTLELFAPHTLPETLAAVMARVEARGPDDWSAKLARVATDLEDEWQEVQHSLEALRERVATVSRQYVDVAERLEGDRGPGAPDGDQALSGAGNEALADFAEVARELDGILLEFARSSYVAIGDRETPGSIRTPTVVLSWKREDAIGVGGHNLRARALRFEPTDAVDALEVVETERGRVVRYNPELTARVAASTQRIARSLEHGGVRQPDLSLPETASIRPRPDVLMVDGRRPENRAVDARLGGRRYAGSIELVEDLRRLAAANDCCLYVAKGANRDWFLVRPDRNSPAGSVVSVAGDAPSLRQVLAAQAADGTWDVVFLDHLESEVEFLTAGLHGPPPGIGGLARVLGRFRPATRGSTVIRYEEGTRATFRDLVSADGIGGALLRRVTELIYRRVLPRDAVATGRSLDETETARLLEGAEWDAASDGVPTAFVVTFGRGSPARLRVNTLLGVDDGDAERASRVLRDTVEDVMDTLGMDSELSTVLMRLRAELEKLPPELQRSLRIVVETGTSRIEFSRRRGPLWMASLAES